VRLVPLLQVDPHTYHTRSLPTHAASHIVHESQAHRLQIALGDDIVIALFFTQHLWPLAQVSAPAGNVLTKNLRPRRKKRDCRSIVAHNRPNDESITINQPVSVYGLDVPAVATAANLRSLMFRDMYEICDWGALAERLSEAFKVDFTQIVNLTMLRVHASSAGQPGPSMFSTHAIVVSLRSPCICWSSRSSTVLIGPVRRFAGISIKFAPASDDRNSHGPYP